MAVAAAVTQITVVGILRPVTARACERCFPVRHVRLVATATTLERMGAGQGEFGQLMVKEARLQANDIRFATGVLTVAGAALLGIDIRVAAMEAAIVIEIGGDFLVTLEAELIL